VVTRKAGVSSVSLGVCCCSCLFPHLPCRFQCLCQHILEWRSSSVWEHSCWLYVGRFFLAAVASFSSYPRRILLQAEVHVYMLLLALG
jgi:hypothetical protein